MSKADYYQVLGVSRTSGETEIKNAYRRLAKKYHPDHNKGNKEAEARFKEVQEAYDVLSDKEKRAKYDQFGHAGIDPRFAGGGPTQWSTADGTSFDFDSIADLFDFGGRGSGGRMGSVMEELLRRAGRGGGAHVDASPEAPGAADLEHPVTLTFDQALQGTTLNLRLEGAGGPETISVRIPPGVRDGQKIRVRGKGQPGRGHRDAGDLYVVCRISPHRYWERREDDIYLMVPVTLTEAALGARIDVPTPTGVQTMTLPAGTASGAKLRLAGQGAPNPKDGRRGDFYAVIKVVPPAGITDEQRRLLEQLAATIKGSPRDGLWS